jgi:porphobilinogen synthase
MQILGQFPSVRMRRMRRDDFSRRLMREHELGVNDLIYPLFVLDGERRREPVASMPGVERLSVDQLFPVCDECQRLGVPVIALFPVVDPALKAPDGREATNAEGLVPRAVRELKQRFPEIGLLTDVALDPYTTHGQDGVIDDSGYVLNDETVAILKQQALVQAAAGVDIVAPSDMMDGRIGAIRTALESAGHIHTRIMAYSAKYASGSRGVATPSIFIEPRQVDEDGLPDGSGEQRRSPVGSRADLAEGADMVMVARQPYSTSCARVKRRQQAHRPFPGQRRIFDAEGVAALNGWPTQVARPLLARKRAGDGVLSYFAPRLRAGCTRSPSRRCVDRTRQRGRSS